MEAMAAGTKVTLDVKGQATAVGRTSNLFFKVLRFGHEALTRFGFNHSFTILFSLCSVGDRCSNTSSSP